MRTFDLLTATIDGRFQPQFTLMALDSLPAGNAPVFWRRIPADTRRQLLKAKAIWLITHDRILRQDPRGWHPMMAQPPKPEITL